MIGPVCTSCQPSALRHPKPCSANSPPPPCSPLSQPRRRASSPRLLLDTHARGAFPKPRRAALSFHRCVAHRRVAHRELFGSRRSSWRAIGADLLPLHHASSGRLSRVHPTVSGLLAPKHGKNCKIGEVSHTVSISLLKPQVCRKTEAARMQTKDAQSQPGGHSLALGRALGRALERLQLRLQLRLQRQRSTGPAPSAAFRLRLGQALLAAGAAEAAEPPAGRHLKAGSMCGPLSSAVKRVLLNWISCSKHGFWRWILSAALFSLPCESPRPPAPAGPGHRRRCGWRRGSGPGARRRAAEGSAPRRRRTRRR